MPSISNEVFQWLDRAEQAREVAGQLTDRGARKAVLELAQSFDRLAEPPLHPPYSGDGSWRRKTTNETCDFLRAFLSQQQKRLGRSKSMGLHRAMPTPEESFKTC